MLMSSAPRRLSGHRPLTCWIAVALFAVAGCSNGASLRADPSVPGDVKALAGSVWADFTDATDHLGKCLSSLQLSVDRDLGDRARYIPGESRVVLRIPGPAARLRQSLLHEFTHHLDYSCLENQEVREGFMEAVNMEGPWLNADAGADAPAELFADAVALVLEQEEEFVRARALPPDGVEFVVSWLGRDAP